MGIQDIAKRLASAKAAGGGNYFKDGRGIAIVKDLKHEKLYKGETFIAELQIESSESYPDAVDSSGKPILANAPGSTVSFIQQFDAFAETAYANTKAFVLSLMGEEESQVADGVFAATYAKLVSAARPARGMRIAYSTFRRTAKKSGKKLVLPRWEHVEQTKEQVKAARALLDGKTEE